jgi:hypothetical protein
MTLRQTPASGGRPISKFRQLAVLALLTAIVSIVLSGCAFPSASAAPAPAARSIATTITKDQLEARYGVRVGLLALTAANGMVDLRLKVVDAAKAAALLARTPTLRVQDSGVVLAAPEDGMPQSLEPVNGRTLFVLFPNSGNTVRHGTSVSVSFDTVELEPIVVK